MTGRHAWWTFTDGASHAVHAREQSHASSTVVARCGLVEDRWRVERDPDEQGPRCNPCRVIVTVQGG
jgi:hypothetical protein